MQNVDSDSRHALVIPGQLTSVRPGRRTVLRTLAASSLAAVIGVGGHPQQAAAQEAVHAAEEMADAFKQWIVSPYGPDGGVVSKSVWVENEATDSNYSLKNTDLGGPETFLQYVPELWGINLGWTKDASAQTEKKRRRWFFTKEVDDQGPILYGQRIALGFGSAPSWLHYKARTVGINLDWSYTAEYEWQILGGPAGDPVRTGVEVAIFNGSANDRGGEPLIYFERPVGADIGWPWIHHDPQRAMIKEMAIEILFRGLEGEVPTPDGLKLPGEEAFVVP